MFYFIDKCIYTACTYIGITITCIFVGVYSKATNSPQAMRQFYSYILRRCFNKLIIIKIIGKQETKPCVYVMNHHSTFDFLLPGLVLRGNTCEMVDENIFTRFPFIGFVLNRIPCVVYRRGKREQVIQESVDMIKNGYSLLLFPEGKRVTELSRFKTGAFEIARKANCRLQYVVCYNSRDYFPFASNTIPYVVPQNEPLTFEFGRPHTMTNYTNEEESVICHSWFDEKLFTWKKNKNEFLLLKRKSLFYIGYPIILVIVCVYLILNHATITFSFK